ncbi:acyclic terpene utilization AtuA family protein [Nocardiopsis ansamitocini]|uniref:Exopolyphosphatase n=1 Tax=Nocardiopsis ansamitocini TaxID=1670832 RepID=A0A9W6P6D4_9ACTN|nr:acyclic terpene utilization AtuA family protein [Nocardiopsis ansamitocini]GLU47843.1 exopolyphosphatase [Nocardiopsis ansamitocini]
MTGTPLRIGNASGFYGDRIDAVHEMLTDGELDVLTGDYLAELTMLILGRDRRKDPARGYARTFVRQMEDCMGLALERGVTIVTNAGGLNPGGLAAELRAIAARLGLQPRIAHVEGDDLLPRAVELGFGRPLTANAYLGAWGIAHALDTGADIVVTGRVTDASLVVGPAAAHFGWRRTDYDALAGAVVAGHIIECGAQATGGNYALFTDLGPDRDLRHPGFPIAEVHADGSSVITKHPGTGGAVTTGTVTAQLLYEIQGPRYAGPDVTARFDTVELAQQGPDRVRVHPVRGEAPPPDTKVCLNRIGGWRNEAVFVLTGLEIPAKAALVREQLETALGADAPAELRWTLARTDQPDAATEQQASALLHCEAKDPERAAVGRPFTAAAVELALASYPGFHVLAPPADAAPYGVYHAGYLASELVEQVVVLADGERVPIAGPRETRPLAELPQPTPPPYRPSSSATRSVPLGRLTGARSGDKGGSATLGVWARHERAWPWLAHTLTVQRLRELLPETAELPIRRHLFPRLHALAFVVDDLLGEGAAARARFDPQAKGLGEWLRARHVDVPEELAR